MHRTLRQRGGEGGGQGLQATGKRNDRDDPRGLAAGAALGRLGAETAQQRTVGALELPEIGEGVAGGEFFRIAGVYARDKRVHAVVHDFPAEMRGHKTREAGVGGAHPRPGQQLRQNAEPGAQREQRRNQQPGGRQRHRDQPAAAHDETFLGRGIHQRPPVLQPEFVQQRGDFRGLLEGIGPALDQPAVLLGGDNGAADLRGLFKNRDVAAGAMQPPSGGEAREASANDGDGFWPGARHFRISNW